MERERRVEGVEGRMGDREMGAALKGMWQYK